MVFEVDKSRSTVTVDRVSWVTAIIGCYVAGWIGSSLYRESHPSWVTFLLPIAILVLTVFKVIRQRRVT